MSNSTSKNTSNTTANQNNDKNKSTVPNGNARTQRTTSDSVFSTTDNSNKNKNKNKDDFTLVKVKNKRLLSSSSASGKKENKKSKQLFISTNRYDPIAINDDMELETDTQSPATNIIIEQEQIKISLPPPIIVRGVKDFISVRADLIDIVGPTNFSVKSTINTLKIQPSNPEAYREIIHYLKDAEAEFHTYQMKEDKAFRIVIRNLHSSTSPIEIRTAIEEIGFSVRSVTNVLSKIEKIKLPLFFVDLEPDEINNNIFEINILLNTKIKIEEPYKRRIIIQCQNFQEYGHSKTYCSYPPRCVRCAAQHLTSSCTKSRDTSAKCVLCNGEHPANYKGCQIHKNLQKLRNPISRNQQPTINTQSNHIQATALPTETRPPPPQQRSYANVTSNQEPPNSHTNQLDTGTMLTSFINDFKALINPHLSLLTTVLNKLIQQNDK